MTSTEPHESFKQLSIFNWQQFGRLDIQFHPRTTIISGANATGKTTLLRLLGSHFEWEKTFYGLPATDAVNRWSKPEASAQPDDPVVIGGLRYTLSPTLSRLAILDSSGPGTGGYNVGFYDRVYFPGVFIPSHRSRSYYAPVGGLPTRFGDAGAMLATYTGTVRGQEENRVNPGGPFETLKQALLAAAVLGSTSGAVEPQLDARAAWEGFEQILGVLFPASMGFEGLAVRNAEIVVRSSSGDFILDEMSGGLSAISELAWTILLRSLNSGPHFTVLLDEPENHLHPALQKQIMPALLQIFPSAQFIVATHSPFVLSSVEDGYVYYLTQGEDGLVEARNTSSVSRASDADEIARDLLGLNTTMPVWAERRYREVLERVLRSPLEAGTADRLRLELEREGIYPEFQRAMVELSSREPDLREPEPEFEPDDFEPELREPEPEFEPDDFEPEA